jgi:hypothetical protein
MKMHSQESEKDNQPHSFRLAGPFRPARSEKEQVVHATEPKQTTE